MLRPGSFGWLVAHDLRLGFLRTRAMFRDARPITLLLILLGVFAVFHLLAWPAAAWFVGARTDAAAGSMYYPALACAALFVLPWLVAQALTNATRALYSHGDLDLLLASPISPRTILAARALAIALDGFLSVGIFLFPIVDMNACLDGWRWLAVYPAVLSSSLFATALGLVVTVALFVTLGPRRTRFFAQILATFIASAFVLGIQIVNVLPAAMYEQIVAAVNTPPPGSLLDRDGPLWLPVRAATGDLSALAGWGALSIALFAVVSIGLGPQFIASAVQSAGVAAATAKPAPDKPPARFLAGAATALRRKEWRLLRRDPFLFSQLLLQIVYTLPISIVIWRSQGPQGSLALATSPCIVVIAAQVSASLAWLAVSSEDAPDFLASAPVASAFVRNRKLEAILAPLILLMALPCIGVATREPGAALLTAVFASGAAASTALLNIWRPHPARRTDILRRHQQSKLLGLLEHALSLTWAVAIVVALLAGWLAVFPLIVIAAILWFARPAPQRLAG